MGSDFQAAALVLRGIDTALLDIGATVGADRIDWDAIEAAYPMLSDSERVLANAAHALYTGQRGGFDHGDEMHQGLASLWQWLDRTQLERVLTAIQLKCGLP